MENIKLLGGEEMLNIRSFNSGPPIEKVSSLSQICRLTGVSKESEIGDKGPTIAALPSESDATIPEHQGLFSVVFGRDSLRVAIDLVDRYPKLAKVTIQKLAELQGTQHSDTREEEPGRIPHEIREATDPIAINLSKKFGWGWPYYGSVDATPEFIRTLSAYCKLSDNNLIFLSQTYINKNSQTQTIANSLTHAVDWMSNRMDSNPEGLLEYESSLEHGIENQVWKDSWDAYHHDDGTIANHGKGIASIEVQVAAHEALLDAADLYDSSIINKHNEANLLRERAKLLSNNILNLFWTDDKNGYFVLGTDRDSSGKLRQLKIRTSNMGHVLNSRIIDGTNQEQIHKRTAILRQLQSPELLCPSGIRTLANDEVRFRESAYHNGSVWIWDTHYIAKGARHMHDQKFDLFANDLDNRILNVVKTIGGFPEFVKGGDKIEVNTRFIDIYDKKAKRINRIEQPPQEIQAWTVSAIISAEQIIAKQNNL